MLPAGNLDLSPIDLQDYPNGDFDATLMAILILP